MKTIGIIVEYNPFHNGHLYHLKKIKELNPNSLIIAVLNGYFTERGEISILTKEDKVNIALENNIDIVVELPFIYGTQSSDTFAYYSIKILNALKVNKIIFGSESNNIELLNKVAEIELNDKDYEKRVKDLLDTGMNYPTALAKALNIDEDINNPNDLLGISYVKAIKQINPKIEIETIKRTNNYHDKELDTDIVSASNIRERINNKEDISKYVPDIVIDKIKNITNEDLFDLLKFKILTDKDLSIYLDVDEGLEYRILKFIKLSNNYQELLFNLKTKRYTYNKLNRMLIHILVGLTKKDNVKKELDYIKILGFNEKGQSYLNRIRKNISIPTKINKDSIIYKYELLSSYIYEQVTNNKTYDYDLKNIPTKK